MHAGRDDWDINVKGYLNASIVLVVLSFHTVILVSSGGVRGYLNARSALVVPSF